MAAGPQGKRSPVLGSWTSFWRDRERERDEFARSMSTVPNEAFHAALADFDEETHVIARRLKRA